MSTVAMSIEGVLGRSPHFDITMQPDPAAQRLYFALAAQYRMVLLTDQENYDKAAHWLASNGYSRFDRLFTGFREARDTVANRIAQLRSLKSSRTDVALVIDPYVSVLDYASSIGIVGLGWFPAQVGAQRVDLQPAPVRSWEEMTGVQP